MSDLECVKLCCPFVLLNIVEACHPILYLVLNASSVETDILLSMQPVPVEPPSS